MNVRVGLGVDAHAFEEGVPLVLGGVAFDSPRGLAGHSDGDVITHALIDAVLGAAGLGDIGSLFPSDTSTPAGISSLDLLRDAVAQVRDAGFAVVSKFSHECDVDACCDCDGYEDDEGAQVCWYYPVIGKSDFCYYIVQGQ